MLEYLDRYRSVITVAAVLLCTMFLAKAVAHIVEDKALPFSAEADLSPAKKIEIAKKKNQVKTAKPVIDRNIFCAECLPPEPTIAPSSGDAPTTSLPLVLLATNVAPMDPERSFATIRNTASSAQGAYWIGETIPNAGKVERISGRFVEFINDSSKTRERILLLSDKPAAKKTTTTTKAATPAKTGKAAFLAELADDIKKTGDNSWEVSRAAVDKAWANPTKLGRQARFLKRKDGVRVYAVRANSLLAKLGVKNGDTINSVNGSEISMQPDKALELMMKLKSANNIEVAVTRGGKSQSLNYTIR